MKLIPASRARWMMRIDSPWSGLPHSPNIMAPRQSGLTLMPVRPRVRVSMERPYVGRQESTRCTALGASARQSAAFPWAPGTAPEPAPFGKRLAAAPQEVVGEPLGGRLLESHHRATLWVHPRHDVLDRPVLAGGVHGLE